MISFLTYGRSSDHVKSFRRDCFLERIPEKLYIELTNTFAQRYHFINGPQQGGPMRLAEYFLGINRSTVNELLRLVQKIIQGAQETSFPSTSLPDGFAPVVANLLPLEQQGGFTFGYFDAAITKDGLQVIEVQGLPTYHMTAAFG